MPVGSALTGSEWSAATPIKPGVARPHQAWGGAPKVYDILFIFLVIWLEPLMQLVSLGDISRAVRQSHLHAHHVLQAGRGGGYGWVG